MLFGLLKQAFFALALEIFVVEEKLAFGYLYEGVV